MRTCPHYLVSAPRYLAANRPSHGGRLISFAEGADLSSLNEPRGSTRRRSHHGRRPSGQFGPLARNQSRRPTGHGSLAALPVAADRCRARRGWFGPLLASLRRRAGYTPPPERRFRRCSEALQSEAGRTPSLALQEHLQSPSRPMPCPLSSVATHSTPRPDALAEHCADGRPAQGPASPAAQRRPAGPSLTRPTAPRSHSIKDEGQVWSGLSRPHHHPSPSAMARLVRATHAWCLGWVSGASSALPFRMLVFLGGPNKSGHDGEEGHQPGTGSGAAGTCPSTPAVEGQLRFAKQSPRRSIHRLPGQGREPCPRSSPCPAWTPACAGETEMG